MADSTRPRTPEAGMVRRNSPPPSPPSPDFQESEGRLSRKREREVSVEPVGNSVVPIQDNVAEPGHEQKDTMTPAKKNRIYLGPTAEEDDQGSRSRSNSPPLSTSPPQEMKIKVRQISQGVEDLSWKNRGQGKNEETTATDAQEVKMNTEPDVQGKEEAETQGLDKEQTPNDSAQPTNDSKLTLTSRRDSHSDSGEKDKGLKRKFLERGTSAGPPEGDVATPSAEPTKRQRDDPGKDDNPREKKRLTPPPEHESAAASTSSAPAPTSGGFMAYASTSSPFASVKGQNIFSSSKPSSPKPGSPFSAGTSSSKPLSTLSTPPGEPSTSTTPAKRSGFEAFASSASPFATATRSKSPALGSSGKFGRSKSPPSRATPGASSAFSAYASSGMQGFALPPQKRARAGSPGSSSSLERNSNTPLLGGNGNGNHQDSGAEDERDDRRSTFGERLRAGKDDDEGSGGDEDSPKMSLTEQEVSTGEEEEETIHQVRGKLFVLADGAWKERGTGLLKLNVRASDGGGARLVMRKEAVHTVLLNVSLFQGMRCTLAQDPRYLRFSAIETGATTHYNLRLANAKITKELLEEIHGNLPSA
ncbi:hypothetical protein V5O48_007648 [Marasmius crinis-equi]|uniref:RanBD1 domain-containing protein n=1 Tax=Marasmius crinis-equi TaxID=585013 RepID=A0ABR3FG46_9AGAR